MSATVPTSFVEWWQNLPIPWLVGGTVGRKEATALGQFFDEMVRLAKVAAKTSWPEFCPSDALAHIGADRGLPRGPGESEGNYITRLLLAPATWKRAGTWAELLVQLYWGGWGRATIVQQSGMSYTLAVDPQPDDDSGDLIDATSTDVLWTPMTSDRNPVTATSPGKYIPAGYNWWTFDSNVEMTNRFGIIFTGAIPLQFRTSGAATFTGIEDGSVAHPWPKAVWSTPFPDSSYNVQVTAVTPTDGSIGVLCNALLGSRQPSSCRIAASTTFSGTCDALGYFASAFADLHGSDSERLQKTVKQWRPPNAICAGIWVLDGSSWGWPAGGTWGWGSGSSTQVMGEF